MYKLLGFLLVLFATSCSSDTSFIGTLPNPYGSIECYHNNITIVLDSTHHTVSNIEQIWYLELQNLKRILKTEPYSSDAYICATLGLERLNRERQGKLPEFRKHFVKELNDLGYEAYLSGKSLSVISKEFYHHAYKKEFIDKYYKTLHVLGFDMLSLKATKLYTPDVYSINYDNSIKSFY